MTFYLKISLKLVATAVASVIAFAVGFLIVGSWYDRTVVPEMIKKYPHDGQIGLGTFVTALNGGFAFAAVVLVLGIFLTYKTSTRIIAGSDAIADEISPPRK